MALNKVKSTVKYPTSLIINGASNLGVELADSLIEQGGYVIIVDNIAPETIASVDRIKDDQLLSFIDHSQMPHIEEDLRRLDYVFYLAHEALDLSKEISTQQFLHYSNYLDAMLGITTKFEAKFMLTTSIKAHQMLIASQELDINFGTSAKNKHSVYTEMELQRYAESLVVEYISKVQLDARVLRLGEIIGDGMDFLGTTSFNQMLLAGVAGEEIPIHRDGLNSEWYLHLLDAVYGLIKAQFARSTAGEFFTLAYEESYTDLSLAYKIHDLEPEAGDIKFIDQERGKSGLPPLQLYKPAKNLSQIGWKPKVPIEDAVKQSLAAAKLFLAQNAARNLIAKSKETKSTAGKLKSFLTLARDVKEHDQPGENDSPLNQLITERRKQENIRTLNISSANSKLKQKRYGRESGFIGSVRNVGWSVFLSFRNRFKFLSDITPGQFLFWIIFSIIGIIFYFYVVSPGVVLVRNYITINNNLEVLSAKLSTNNFQDIEYNLYVVDEAIIESNNILAGYSGLLTFLDLGEEYTTVNQLLDTYHSYFDGMKQIASSLKPFYEYLNAYEDRTFYRPNSDSYLAIESTNDYKDFLGLLAQNADVALAGKQEVETALTKLSRINMDVLPIDYRQQFSVINTRLVDSREALALAELPGKVPAILGYNAAKTYLLLLQDNSRFTPSGGELSAFVLVTVNNGAISEVRAQSINSVSLDSTKIDNIYKDLAIRRSVAFSVGQAFSIYDLGNLTNLSDYTQAHKQLLEAAFNREISGVITLNYTALQSLVNEASGASDSSISVENIEFSGTNLLSNLQIMQTQTPTLERRNDIAIQLLAVVTDKMLDHLGSDMINYLSTLASFAQNKDIQTQYYDRDLIKLVPQTGRDLQNANTYLRPTVKADRRITSPSKFPSVSLATQATINTDASLRFTSNIRFPALENIDEAVICLPSAVSSINLANIPTDRYRISDIEKEKCVIINITNESELVLSWQTPAIASLNNSQYNLNLGLYKQSGISQISDYEIRLAAGLKLESISPEVNLEANQTVFTETMVSDRYINILLSK
jgi:nucleoside-diphosphate-sugar epimerase